MKKLNYTYTNVPKQLVFYICIFYLILRSIVDIQIKVFNIAEYSDTLNLPLSLFVNACFAALWILLSNGHKACGAEYDDEKIIYQNRILRKKKEFHYSAAQAVFFDKKGIYFFSSSDDAADKSKAIFFIPFFRDGKIDALNHKAFYDLMKAREAEINDPEEFVVYRSYKEVPGYGRNWKYVSFAYACLDVLLLLNCSSPLAVILGLFMNK